MIANDAGYLIGSCDAQIASIRSYYAAMIDAAKTYLDPDEARSTAEQLQEEMKAYIETIKASESLAKQECRKARRKRSESSERPLPSPEPN